MRDVPTKRYNFKQQSQFFHKVMCSVVKELLQFAGCKIVRHVEQSSRIQALNALLFMYHAVIVPIQPLAKQLTIIVKESKYFCVCE